MGGAGSGRRRQAAGRGASRAGGKYEGHEKHRREAMRGALRARRGEAYERGRLRRGGEGRKGGRGKGVAKLRKPTEEEEGGGPDAAAGTGAHTGADIARGAQGGAGGLGASGRSSSGPRSALSGFRRFRYLGRTAGGSRGGTGRASGAGEVRDVMSHEVEGGYDWRHSVLT